MPPPVGFRNIVFGYASAEVESKESPELLIKGFYDSDGTTAKLLDPSCYLVLGFKGSGKTALAKRLSLLAAPEPLRFTQLAFLGDLPFTQFSRLLQSDNPVDEEGHFIAAWQWVLITMLLQSFAEDNGGTRTDGIERALHVLRESGLIPSKEVKTLILTSVKSGLAATLWKIFTASRESTLQQDTSTALLNLELLKGLATQFKSPSQHLLVIDGLDDLLTQKAVQFAILAALLQATVRLNDSFREAGTPAKILLLCRTDIFEKLPAPNKNKVRQDCSIELDWYHDPKSPGNSKLVELANHRASLSLERPLDIFSTFFPRHLDTKDARVTLANHTRHTPRDFLRLLSYIQEYSLPGKLTPEAIHSGMRKYSTEYFLPELRDELVGFAAANQIDRTFALIGAMRKSEFLYPEIATQARKMFGSEKFDLSHSLNLLFECSAIGNVDPGSGHFWFKFRNRSSRLNEGNKLVLHPGLKRAFNL